MPINDHISNMLTRVRNAQMAAKRIVEMPSSNMLVSIAAILQEEGFIENFRYVEDGKQGIIRIGLRRNKVYGYAITGIKKISKPGRRVYVGKEKLPVVKRGYGISILSTSRGVMTGDKARELGVGGEVLCEIW
jgi:small subunit ribosomal protein S8